MAKKNAQSKSDEQLAQELTQHGVDPDVATVAAIAANALTTATTGENPNDAAQATGSKPTDRTRSASTGGSRVRIEPGSTPSQVLAAHITDRDALYNAAVLSRGDEPNKRTFDAMAQRLDGLAKKVAEKGVNLLRYRSEPEKVQVYTSMGLNALIEQGEATSKSLTDLFGRKYKPGTARAQSNQLMSLFPALGIAERSGSTLKLSKDSMIVRDFKRASTKTSA